MAHLNDEELKEALSTVDVQTEEVEIKPEAREFVELLFSKEKLVSAISGYLPKDENSQKVLKVVADVISDNYEFICESSVKAYSENISTEELQALVDFHKKYPNLQDRAHQVGAQINQLISTGKVAEDIQKGIDASF